ncbi:hypothetical protein GXB85_02025 [Cellulomonas sp. APG4]|uniref:hypothetical protein n=1 Tax=Cellulomonas sp. APG4 TaxID=1538656 RepID=UPI001379F982|nr:hypothetical protein [Cellulomonas sp. APG4]NCT89734.1 hypothetical protein [Cellulomonas sp. APG4]
MEDTTVGQQVTLTPEVVRQRLRNLENLLDELDAVITAVGGVRRRQGAAMWSSVPVCQQFAGRLSESVGNLHGWLVHDRTEVGRLRDALEVSWRTLGAADQEIEDRLVALADRVATGAPVGPLYCTPYDDPETATTVPGAPTTSAPAAGPAPTSSVGGSW